MFDALIWVLVGFAIYVVLAVNWSRWFRHRPSPYLMPTAEEEDELMSIGEVKDRLGMGAKPSPREGEGSSAGAGRPVGGSAFISIEQLTRVDGEAPRTARQGERREALGSAGPPQDRSMAARGGDCCEKLQHSLAKRKIARDDQDRYRIVVFVDSMTNPVLGEVLEFCPFCGRGLHVKS